MHQGQVILIDPEQLLLPHTIVQSARVKVGESLFGNDCAAEALKKEHVHIFIGPFAEEAAETG